MKKTTLKSILLAFTMGLISQGTMQAMDPLPKSLKLLKASLLERPFLLVQAPTMPEVAGILKSLEPQGATQLKNDWKAKLKLNDSIAIDTSTLGTPINRFDHTYYDRVYEVKGTITYEAHDKKSAKNTIATLRNERDIHDALESILTTGLFYKSIALLANTIGVLTVVGECYALNTKYPGSFDIVKPILWNGTKDSILKPGAAILIGAGLAYLNHKKSRNTERLLEGHVDNTEDHSALHAFTAEQNNRNVAWFLVSEIKESMPAADMPEEIQNADNKCSICYSTMDSARPIKSLRCRHKFHKECIDLNNLYDPNITKTCPYCRQNQ